MSFVRTEPTLRVVASPTLDYEEPRPGSGIHADQWPEPRAKVAHHRMRAFVVVLILCAAGAALWSVLRQSRDAATPSQLRCDGR